MTTNRRLNHQLSSRPEIAPATDLAVDLSDGVRLIHLLEIIGRKSLGKYAVHPKLRVQKAENVSKALAYIRLHGLQLWNIGAEDLLDGNLKLILGLLWTLILRFSIEQNVVNEEGLSAKQGLLLWAQRKTAPYEGVNVVDFSASWSDGLAFCALIDRHRPDLLDFASLDKSRVRENTASAFQIAAKELGIGQLLEVDDVCVPHPDERSIMTYLSQMYTAFSELDKIETAGRRVEKFLEIVKSAREMQRSFEERMMQLITSVKDMQTEWQEACFDDTYANAKVQAMEFERYKGGWKREWITEKSNLGSLLGNIQAKLKTYGLHDYTPPVELSFAALDAVWQALLQSEARRSKEINQKIREYASLDRGAPLTAGSKNLCGMLLQTKPTISHWPLAPQLSSSVLFKVKTLKSN